MTKYLVTGAAGFIGSNIVDRLISFGHEVIAIDNESSDSNETFYWNKSAKNYKLDICEYEKIRSLFEGVDYVLHLAAEARIQPSIHNPLRAIKTNTVGTATVLQCSMEAGVRRVVYSSTSSAYGRNKVPNIETQVDDCMTPYSVSKVSGEKLCAMYYQLFNLETITLRYFNVYGSRQPMKGVYAPLIGIFERQKAAGQSLTITGDGKQKRDFTNILDVVDANILAASADIPKDYFGTIFNIGTGINYSINEIAEAYKHRSIYIESRPGESTETLADNSKARNILGWKPTIVLLDYIKNMM
jgi:UDP-glucose 4-epimerase